MNNDLISREALKKAIEESQPCCDAWIGIIDNAPTVKFSLLPADESKDEAYMRGYEKGLAVGLLKTSPQGEWIPIVMRPGTDEEYEDFCRYGDCPREDFQVFDCPTPDDEQEVFVTTRWGNVCIDIWHRDVDCCYFEDNCDDGDVIAWMPIPEPYKESEDK